MAASEIFLTNKESVCRILAEVELAMEDKYAPFFTASPCALYSSMVGVCAQALAETVITKEMAIKRIICFIDL
jgi:hypothetical protein